jgi:hypothetical protein
MNRNPKGIFHDMAKSAILAIISGTSLQNLAVGSISEKPRQMSRKILTVTGLNDGQQEP